MQTGALKSAAQALSRARLEGEQLAELPDDIKPGSETEAYQLQVQLHRLLTGAGHGQIAGYKIGCTTAVMQRFLQIPNPCAGGVFDSTVFHERATVRHADYRRVGVECEIAVRLAAEPDVAQPHDDARLLRSIESAMAAIEIVDDRWQDYTRISTPTLIADDFFGAGCVLGAPVCASELPDLGTLAGRMQVNGQVVGEGVGQDILGHPLNALRWLVTARMGQRQLQAGTFVLLGSLVQTVWVAQGDEVTVDLEGLGSATLRLE